MDEELRLKLQQSFIEWKAANADRICTLSQQYIDHNHQTADIFKWVFYIALTIFVLSTARMVRLSRKDELSDNDFSIPFAVISAIVSIISVIITAILIYSTPAITDLLIFR